MRTRKPKDFKQFDSRWAKKMYSSRGDKAQTMKKAGCAPTAAADVVWELAGQGLNPYDLALMFVDKKYRVDGKGTKPGCFKWTAKRFGLAFKRLYKLKGLVNVLDAGGLVVAHMGPGYWTQGGHYIVLWAYRDGYLYACDPGSSTRKKQDAQKLVKQAKGFYAFQEKA